MLQRFYIDGVEVKNPLNYALNEIELNFDKGESKAQVSINSWDLGVGDSNDPTDGANIALARKNNGLTGGLGVTEGLPFKVDIDKAGTQLNIFDGYLDLWKARYKCGLVTAEAVEQGKMDWLKSGAADVSFEYLASIGLITEANYILVPYVIENPDAAKEVFMSTITVFMVSGELLNQILILNSLAIEAANPFEATAIARLVIQIVYTATLLVALVKLIIDTYNLIVQPVKYHATMLVNDLLTIGLNHIGLQFSSSFLQASPLNDLKILPEKYATKKNTDGIFQGVKGLFEKDKTNQIGYPSQGYTLADLLAAIQIQFHAKFVLDGTTLRIEKQNYNFSAARYQLRPVDDSEYFLNEDDFISNFFIEYATDLEDRNTIQEYLGTSYQVQVVPQSVLNKKMVLTKRLERISINFALAKRKTELTFAEKIFDAFFKIADATLTALIEVINFIIKVVNKVIRVLNKIIKALGKIGIDIEFELPEIPTLDTPSFGNLIEDRIGMMKMESDYVNVPKMLLTGNNTNARNNKLLADNETVLSAKYLWDNFHFLKSFVPQPGNELGNQYYVYPMPKDYFCWEDYQKVRADNKIISADGTEQGLIDSLKWNIDEQVATGQYRIQRTYTKNLIEIKTEPSGI